MEDTAALLGSSAIKQRLAGVTGLLEQLRRQDAAPEASATLIPHVLPCLRDHNSKIALGALEILQLLVSRVAESTLRSYFKLLWLSLVERLGDSKLPVREKAVDVVVEISVVLDVGTVLDKLKACMGHKNWRTRGQSLHAVWRCLERHELFKEKQDELLDDVLKLLEDSSKDVRDAAITALEKFYMYIGASLLSDLEYKNIRSAQVKTLTDRFERIPVRSKESRAVTRTAPSNDDRSNQDYDDDAAQDNGAPEKYSSILSSYDLQVSSSSSSVARYLASVRSRTINEAKAMADGPGDGDRSPSQASSTSSKVVQDFSAAGTLGSGGGDISEKEIQKQLGVVFDKLHLDNNWDKRVDGLKMLQKLAKRCGSASNSGAILPFLSQGLRPIRERLCQQVSDLRSSVSREACQTIQTLAGYLRDEFNAHAEICLGNLLKATYVTIQVISTSADTTIRSMIESTSNGYARVIPKLIECAKSRNQVLRYNAVCYLTLTLQRWSTSFLSKHSDMFVPILPAILQDALGDVRAQSRKCYWAFHHLFPDEANGVFARLDGTTQKNLKDDPSKIAAKTARKTEFISMDAPAPQTVEVGRSVLRSANAVQPSSNAPVASSSVTFSDEQPSVVRVTSSGDLVSEKLPRRVLGGNSGLAGDDTAQENLQPSRMLSQGPMRVGRVKTPVSKEKSTSSNDRKKGAPAGPLRVWNAPPKPSQTPSTAMESLYASRQEPSTASFHTSSKNPTSKAQRVQRAAEAQAPVPMDIDDAEPSGPKRLPVASMPSPTASNASSSRTNNSSRGDPVDVKSKPARTVPAKPSERPKVAQLPVADELEEALRNIESRSWSTRLEAAEYIGKILQRRLDQIDSGARGDYKLDGRILTIFIKHLSDAHYRVSQGVLKYFLPLLKLSNDSQRLLPHLKTVLPKLFQKYIDTKESIRVIAKENLEYIASAIDSSTLAALVISMLGDGSNMKVKAAMCHYLRDLLPGAGEYLKHGANNSHMRSFLLKIALLMDTDVPVSVSSACGELVSIAAQLYGPEIEVALGLLPPSKRLVVSKVLKSKKIVLNFSRPPLSSSAAPHSARSRDGGDDDNQDMELPVPKPERSRKRPESPSVSSSSPARPSSQKRINTAVQIHAAVAAESERTGDRPSRPAPAKQHDEKMTGKTALSGHPVLSQVAFSSAAATVDNYDVQLDDLLLLLEQNNLSEAEIKHTLYKTLHFIETESSATWDRCFGRLLLLLLDAATDQDVHALKVLQKLVEAQPSRAQMFFELLLQRLIDAIGDQVDVARHLMERILHDLVSFASDHQQTLSTLMPLVPRVDPPALQVVLRLVKVCLQACERRSAHDAAFLRQPDVANSLMGALTRRLDHATSSVRKNVVDCLVAFHFATKEDSAIVPKYLAAELDDTRRRLVEIFIDRAKVERHPVGLST